MRRVLFAFALAFAVQFAAYLAGCGANDPFDPESVTNARPTVRIFAAPVDSGASLHPGSYLGRRFSWSGSDRDGWIVEYHVSIRTSADTPAPWLVTTQTDTAMAFTTDENGEAEATVLVACRDNRGALSDTAMQFFPIRDFPPVLEFERDFDPLSNMQREIIDGGTAGADTVYWNWGVCDFRMVAYDPDDGNLPEGYPSTMDPFYRYTLAENDPDVTWDFTDPDADPEIGWVRVPFLSFEDRVGKFRIALRGIEPGLRTLTVSVADEGSADGRFEYAWDVRAPRGPVLLVTDNTSSLSKEFFAELLDTHLGVGNWDTYAFINGFPDNPFNFLDTIRLYPAVIWPSGATLSTPLAKATSGDANNASLLQRYVGAGGRLLHVSVGLAGTTSELPRYYIATMLGIASDLAPIAPLKNFGGLQALGQESWLPPMTASSDFGTAIGLAPLAGTEVLYRMEECCTRGCFGTTNRPPVPCDPAVVVRRPGRATADFADVVSAGLQPEYFLRPEAVAAFTALLRDELGVSAP